MDTKRYTPAKVVKENLSFSIPLYQRLFTWGEEQIYGLLKDMQEHFAVEESPYYLGMLSCINNKGRFDLIDGQQRFTVMSLMGIVFKKYFPDSDWKYFLDEGRRLEFTARTKDKEYLVSKISGSSVCEVNHKMEAAIGYIESFMEDGNVFKDASERKKYAELVYKNLSFYFSELPQEYLENPASLNKYFEAMNAQGKCLEQHEILKVELAKNEPEKEYLIKIWNAVSEMGVPVIRRSAEESIENYRNKYADAISFCRNGEFEKAFKFCSESIDGENTIRIGDIEPKKPEPDNVQKYEAEADRSIHSFPDFLLMVLDMHQSLRGRYSYYRKDLISAFRQYKPSDIKAFYHSLLFYRLIFDYYVIVKENTPMGNKYNILYADQSDSGDSLQKECVIRYQSMLYVSQTPIYDWLKPLLEQIRQQRPVGYSQILRWLKDKDDSLSRSKLPISSKDMSYKSVDRYWFWRLDYYLWEKQDEYLPDAEDREIVNEYVFRSNRSIEHLHPQSQTQNSKWEESDIDSFGNLAMISQGFNSEQSDDPVTVKFARINDQAKNHNIQSLKMYRMYLDAGKTPGGWTLEKKKTHEEEMFHLLQESFKRE